MYNVMYIEDIANNLLVYKDGLRRLGFQLLNVYPFVYQNKEENARIY